ncbi:YceI family protein [Flavihumibacter fluvii]|uniref:YceI family protein n=1 Tax=Flavihumibacter fluvii TaxID=2838157 RepID=UPI001BDF50D1|nr:YceI family protein [Flavihumibacter fluvii]ULQ53442.1 YceI family protein [Flavihumibacter fluvii]
MLRMTLLIIMICSYATAFSQRYITRNGIARFYSRTDLEDIAAENKQVMAVLDPDSRLIAVSMLMKGFLFKKELMQDHFNENYVESDRFPKAIFEGTFAETIDISENAVTKLLFKGKLSLHGVSREVALPATVVVKNGIISGNAEFQLVPEDYQIRIPNLVRDKISRKVDVFISVDLKKQ